MPNSGPGPSTSPGRRLQTIRRAMAPEICRTTSRRCGGDSLLQADPRILVPQRTLRVQGVEELAGRVPQRQHPRPAGARFKCTLKIDRKMPIRTAGPPMNSSCGRRVISTTCRRPARPAARARRESPQRIAKEVDDQTQADGRHQSQIPIRSAAKGSSAPAAASPSVATRPAPSGQTAAGRASGTGRRPGPNGMRSGCGSISGRGIEDLVGAPAGSPRRKAAMRRT